MGVGFALPALAALGQFSGGLGPALNEVSGAYGQLAQAQYQREALEAQKALRALQMLEYQRKMTEPFSVPQGTTLLDPRTYQPIFTAPTKPERPVLVAPGGTLIDPATHQPIYEAPSALKEKPLPEGYMWDPSGELRAVPIPGLPPGAAKEPKSDFQTFYAAGKAKGWDDARISQEWHKQKVAEATRIQIAGAEARGEAYGMNRPINVLDTAQANAPKVMTLREMRKLDPGGSRFIPATSGERALLAQARAEEMRDASRDVERALDSLPEFTAAFHAKMAAVLRDPDPRSALSLFLTTQAARTLSREEYFYLATVQSLVESSYAMRTIIGVGQGSDLARAAIAATVPGPTTPTKEAARTRLGTFNVQIDRLARGIPFVQLPPGPAPPVPSGVGGPARGQTGIVGPASDPRWGGLPEGDVVKWRDGKRYRKQNGVPVPVSP